MQPRGDPVGLFDMHYRAFLETLTHVRADLHRYCTRMTGSVFGGEDVMQETLFEAYRKIEALDDPSALRPWLFRMAHNRRIDFLRKRDSRERAESRFAPPRCFKWVNIGGKLALSCPATQQAMVRR
jgi:RNA polymerase sigma-70 factor, ECF subfamily